MLTPDQTMTILTKAREKIALGWCQEVYARDAKGKSVISNDVSACRWCVVGALSIAVEDCSHLFPEMLEFLSRFLPSAVSGEGESGLGNYNDARTTTQQDILALLDRAIAVAKKTEVTV